jgi:hypothetical protein
MGASFNHFGTILNFETINSKCHASTHCSHYAIGFPEDTKSHFGPLLDTSLDQYQTVSNRASHLHESMLRVPNVGAFLHA